MTEGQTPAGWYDDGQGQLRWFDGTAWTEHTQPLAPPVPAPAPAAPAAPVEPTAPVAAAPVAAEPVAAAPVAAAPVGAAPVGAAPVGAAPIVAAPVAAAVATQPIMPINDEPEPFYKKKWFIPVVAVLVVLIAVIAFLALKGNGKSSTTSTSSTGTSTPAATAGGASYYGAPAATVAAKAGCTPTSSAVPAPSQSVAGTTASGAQPSSTATCTIGQISYTVVTWASPADQADVNSLNNAFTKPITAGTKYFASGNGWTAFAVDYGQATAQTFATPAGGTVKAVVVVLGATPGATPSVS